MSAVAASGSSTCPAMIVHCTSIGSRRPIGWSRRSGAAASGDRSRALAALSTGATLGVWARLVADVLEAGEQAP